MQEIILVRYGEIVLKGLNRHIFEEKLISNIKNALKHERFNIWHSQARIYIEPLDEPLNVSSIIEKLTRIFGIISVSPAYKVEPNMEAIYKAAEKCLEEEYNIKTFKVETKRGNKNFPLISPEISRIVGAHILSKFKYITVDVNNPDIVINVEIRENAYVYTKIIYGCGGLPIGTNGKALLLLSGGIDSPVAGWMIAKRGVEIEAIHFFSPPYTGQKSKEKVIDLCRILAKYTGRIRLYVIPFTNIQVELKEKCPEEQLTILMRRYMLKIAEEIAKISGCSALVTGENLGQVASQTMESLVVTDSVVNMPVFRPLIGFDKIEIIELAKKINTYETSILPYEDCCTLFLPKRPVTKPKLQKIKASEKKLDIQNIIEKAIKNREIIDIFE